MYLSYLRKIGRSIMLAIPSPILNILRLRAGSRVILTIDNGRLLIEAQSKKNYNVDKLLAQCDTSREIISEERQWLHDSNAIGKELL